MKTRVNNLLTITIILTTCLLLSCTNSNEESNVNNLNLDIIMLDANGNEKNYFTAEDDIKIALKATNISDEPIELWDTFEFTRLINENEDFFLIYKILQNNERIPIGKPFIVPIEYGGVNSQIIISGKSEQFICIIRWLENPNNTSLESGTYYSGFFIDINGKMFTPEITFTVQ